MRNFVHTVIELVQQGMTICGVEWFIQQMRQHNAVSSALQLHTALQCKYSGHCPPNLLSRIEASEAKKTQGELQVINSKTKLIPR